MPLCGIDYNSSPKATPQLFTFHSFLFPVLCSLFVVHFYRISFNFT